MTGFIILYAQIIATVVAFRGAERYSLRKDTSSRTECTSRIGSTQLRSIQAKVVGAIMDSPLYTPIVGMARKTMVKSAVSVGVEWEEISQLLEGSADWDAKTKEVVAENPNISYPEYYKQRFHGYKEGNLCLSAAIEQELAGKAVGARNFPEHGADGEEMLRRAFDVQIAALGGTLPVHKRMRSNIQEGDKNTTNKKEEEEEEEEEEKVVVVDFGCGTGTSTRRLAKLFPQAQEIIGFDLSPHMIAIGRYLQTEVPSGSLQWVEDFPADERVSLRYADCTQTGLPDASVDVVSASLIMHELPASATKQMIEEAHRILKPGGSFFISEMDPSTPGYRKLRGNPWLFSILRSTEPFLDEYFDDVAPILPELLQEQGRFPVVKMTAATGRHFALVASKAGLRDVRPSDAVRLADDQHVVKKLSEIVTE